MGTRSLTRINEGEKQYINMYRQHDGYPSGHGSDLFSFLDGMVLINGIGSNRPPKAANGAGCLAAQLIGAFKEDIGGIYVYPVASTDCGQDYEYVINVDENLALTVTVLSFNGEKFTGSVAEFGDWCVKAEED